MDDRVQPGGLKAVIRWGMRASLLAALLLVGTLAGGETPAPAPAAKDPRLESLIRRMDEVQKEIQTLKVSFTQSNQFRMLKEPQVLRGSLLLRKPDTALYRYSSPSPLIFLALRLRKWRASAR